jgi:hypothetical protein
MSTGKVKSKGRRRRLSAAEVVRLQGVCRERLSSSVPLPASFVILKYLWHIDGL